MFASNPTILVNQAGVPGVASSSGPGLSPARQGLWPIFEGMPIGIIVSRSDLSVVRVNASARASFGVKEAAPSDTCVDHYLPAFHGVATAGMAMELLHTAGDHMIGVSAAGGEVPCEVALSRLQSADGDYLLWVIRDVSLRTEIENQKKSLEKELEQAHRLEALGTMAGGIAHELNTPIQFVSDNMRFLRDAFRDLSNAVSALSAAAEPALVARVEKENDLSFINDEVPKAIEQSLEGLSRAADIVLAIKRFSHPSGDAKEPNDLNEIISTTATVSKNQWKYVADLDLDLDPTLPKIKSNAGELNQVLINMIVNAAHAIEEKNDPAHKGKITISTKRVGNAVACSITDTGVGIPGGIRARIFDLFFTTKPPGRGTGQGLALVHKIITSHGGRITVDSEVGKGTRFIFVLPLDGSRADVPPSKESA